MKGFNMNILKQAKEMARKLEEAKESLADIIVEASSGGGMVTASTNAAGKLVSIKIEPEVVDPDDVEMLEDLIVAAVSEALEKAQQAANQEMAKITGGMNIPGLT